MARPKTLAVAIWRQPNPEATLPWAVELQREDGDVLVSFLPNWNAAIAVVVSTSARLEPDMPEEL